MGEDNNPLLRVGDCKGFPSSTVVQSAHKPHQNPGNNSPSTQRAPAALPDLRAQTASAPGCLASGGL